MIDRSKFLEPTPKYCEENPDLSKDWFNADLIYFANVNMELPVDPKLLEAYNDWKDFYDVTLEFNEAQKIFSNYSLDSFNELMTELVKSLIN